MAETKTPARLPEKQRPQEDHKEKLAAVSKEAERLRKQVEAAGKKMEAYGDELKKLEEELRKAHSESKDQEAGVVLIMLRNLEKKVAYLDARIKRNEVENKNQEARELRDKIVGNLDEGLKIVKEAIGKNPGNTPEERTTKERMKWVIGAIEGARKSKDYDAKAGQFTVSDPDTGKQQREGLPVDELINVLNTLQQEEAKKAPDVSKEKDELVQLVKFLNKQIQKTQTAEPIYNFVLGKGTDPNFTPPAFLKKRPDLLDQFDISNPKLAEKYGNTLSAARDLINFLIKETEGKINELEKPGAKETAESRKIKEIVKTLEENSKGYFELRPDMKGDRQHWRTRLESKYASLDYRSTGNLDTDYKLAMELMNKRLELVLPQEVDLPAVGEAPIEEPLPVTTPDKPKLLPPHEDEIIEPEVIDQKLLPPHEEIIDTETVPEQLPPHPEKKLLPPHEIRGLLPPHEIIPPPNKPAYMVDISEIVKRMAWTQAEERVNEFHRNGTTEVRTPKPERKGFFKKLGGGIADLGRGLWNAGKDIVKHPVEFLRRTSVRFGEPYYLNKFYQAALKEIQSNRSLMAEIESKVLGKRSSDLFSGDKDLKNLQILDSVLESYTAEIAEAEEKGEVVRDDEVNGELANLFYEYSTGAIADQKTFNKAVHDRVAPIMKRKGFKFSSDTSRAGQDAGLMYAHNFFEIAQGYKTYIQEKVAEITQSGEYAKGDEKELRKAVKGLLKLDIQLGLKERDVRETKPRGTLRCLEWLVNKTQSVPYLNKVIANPLIYSAAVSPLATIGLRGGLRALGVGALAGTVGALAGPLVAAGLGGLFLAARRGRDLRHDRGLELRRQALDQEVGGRNAHEVRKFSYDMVRLDEAILQLEDIYNAPQIDNADVDYVAQMYARLGIEKSRGVDMFSSTKSEGSELGTKIASINKLKITLKNIERKHRLSVDAIQTQINNHLNGLTNDNASKDKEFGRWVRKEKVKAAALGATGGLIAGTLAQAGWMAASGRFGESALGKLASVIGGGAEYAPVATGVSEMLVLENQFIPGTNTNIRLPQGWIMDRDGDTLSIINSKGEIVADNIEVLPDDSISPDGLDAMRDAGIRVSEHVVDVPGETFSTTLQEVPVEGMPGATLRLPDNVSIVHDVRGGYYLENSSGKILNLGHPIEFIDGKLTPDSQDALRNLFGWDIGEGTQTITETLRSPDEIREYLRAQYNKGMDHDDWRRIWHGNKDTRLPFTNQATSMDNPDLMANTTPGNHSPYSVETGGGTVAGTVRDFREIMNAWNYDSSTGNLRLSVTNRIEDMLQHGGSRGNGIVDDKFERIGKWLRAQHGDMSKITERFSIRVYLNEDDYKAGLAVSLPVDSQGNIDIPPGSPLHEMLVDENGRPKLRIETCFNNNESGTYEIISTAGPHGNVDELTITREVPITELTHPSKDGSHFVDYTTDIDLPPSPTPDDTDEPFLFPLPGSRRRPMEKPAQKNKKPEDKGPNGPTTVPPFSGSSRRPPERFSPSPGGPLPPSSRPDRDNPPEPVKQREPIIVTAEPLPALPSKSERPVKTNPRPRLEAPESNPKLPGSKTPKALEGAPLGALPPDGKEKGQIGAGRRPLELGGNSSEPKRLGGKTSTKELPSGPETPKSLAGRKEFKQIDIGEIDKFRNKILDKFPTDTAKVWKKIQDVNVLQPDNMERRYWNCIRVLGLVDFEDEFKQLSYPDKQLVIKRLVKELSKKFHVDKNPDPKANEVYLKIRQAQDVLLDVLKSTH